MYQCCQMEKLEQLVATILLSFPKFLIDPASSFLIHSIESEKTSARLVFLTTYSINLSMASTSQDNTRGSSELLRNAQFSQSSTNAGSDDMTAPSVAQMLNNAASLHPLAAQNSQDLDYLILDDGKLSDIEGGQSVLPSRGWGDELCYGTGTTYLAGELAIDWVIQYQRYTTDAVCTASRPYCWRTLGIERRTCTIQATGHKSDLEQHFEPSSVSSSSIHILIITYSSTVSRTCSCSSSYSGCGCSSASFNCSSLVSKNCRS